MTSKSSNNTRDPEIGETMDIDVSRLRLDRKNPRLVESDGSMTEEQIIAGLYSTEALDELLYSMATNGYMNIEPLVVCLEESNEQFVVIEGNRRLAAIMLFRDEKLSKKVEAAGCPKINIPIIDKKKLDSLSRVSVHHVKERADAREFIGFKHINGPAKWDSYAKAKFAAEWHEKNNLSLDDIASKIGDRHDTVKRMVTAIYILKQADKKGVYSISDRMNEKFNFSHFYTAISRTDYMNYLGLGKSWAGLKPNLELVPEDKLECLGFVLVWMFGSKEKGKKPLVRTQNPDIKRLGEVLDDKNALRILRSEENLDEAHMATKSSEDNLYDSLRNAQRHLAIAATNLDGYDGKDSGLLRMAKNVANAAKAIFRQLKELRRESRKDKDVS